MDVCQLANLLGDERINFGRMRQDTLDRRASTLNGQQKDQPRERKSEREEWKDKRV